MVIGLLGITAIPTVVGVSLGISEDRKQKARMEDERRMAKFYMDISCDGGSQKAKSLDGKRIVLRDNKVRELVICSSFHASMYLHDRSADVSFCDD